VLSCCSYHFDHRGLNQRNFGIGYERSVSGNWRIAAGAYDNSMYKVSAYAGGVCAPFQAGGVRLGAMAGVITGYRTGPVPIVVPTVLLEAKTVGANVLLVPISGGVVGVQFKVRF
jgi:hypothetical protein